MAEDELDIDLDDLARRMDGPLAALRTEFASLRTGRASASMYTRMRSSGSVRTDVMPNPLCDGSPPVALRRASLCRRGLVTGITNWAVSAMLIISSDEPAIMSRTILRRLTRDRWRGKLSSYVRVGTTRK